MAESGAGTGAVQVALVGGAHIHTPNFLKKLIARENLRAVAVWDHDAARAQHCAATLGAETRDLAAIWADPAISAVVICAETDRHPDLVSAAASAGKHLFVEKPLGISGRESQTMATAIERAGVIFQTGYFMRGQPINRFLREEIQRGSFGTITRLRLTNCHAGALRGIFDTEWRWLANPAVAGFGGFGDLGTHVLDLLLWFLGGERAVEAVTATVGTVTGRYGNCDEYGEGLLAFSDGLIGSIAAGWVDTVNPVTLDLSGTGGHATVVNGELYVTSSSIAGAAGKAPWRELPPLLPHAFDLFLDAITGQTDVPLVSAHEAATRSKVMEALYFGARERIWVPVR